MKPSSRLPEKFLIRLATLYPPSTVAAILESFTINRPTTFRLNPLAADPAETLETLNKLGFSLEESPFWNLAYCIKQPPLGITIDQTESYQRGQLYVQNWSSMLPALALNVTKGQQILDLCAAPGSKTTQIAALMQNTGHIVAVDPSRTRRYRLEANLKRQCVTNTTVLSQAGETIWHEYPEFFDATLVDVPCSMEGRFSLSDPKSYMDWSSNKVKILSKRQKFILYSAISATKVGGTIVYSTCTLSPEENEGVVDWILKKLPNTVILEPISFSHITPTPSVKQWNTKMYNPQISQTCRILPSTTMEGFYIAKFKKIRSNTYT